MTRFQSVEEHLDVGQVAEYHNADHGHGEGGVGVCGGEGVGVSSHLAGDVGHRLGEARQSEIGNFAMSVTITN